MLSYEQFEAYITKQHSKERFTKIVEDIYSIISLTTACGNDYIERRMNSFIVLGWDLMVDIDMRVWLIECNRSPDLTASTSITKDLTERMFVDLAKMFCQ